MKAFFQESDSQNTPIFVLSEASFNILLINAIWSSLAQTPFGHVGETKVIQVLLLEAFEDLSESSYCWIP